MGTEVKTRRASEGDVDWRYERPLRRRANQ